jgi:methylenetetrahydrofolate reductase (NADPH)
MRISEIYAAQPFALSFELFPPKTDAGLESLFGHVKALSQHKPGFITCTYGAGGSTRDKTLAIVSAVRRQFQMPVASHLTCVGSTVDDLREYLAEAQQLGIDNIVALRGDPPHGQTDFRPVVGGLRYASELVELIRREYASFGIAVAGYPEKHQEAPSLDVDLQHLRCKVDCGADAVITQLFYDNRDFFVFRNRCQQLGIRVPIIPGLLPVTNLGQIQRITSLCGARLPKEFVARLAEHDDEQWQFEVGVEYAIRQVQELIDQGVRGIHFYVLNKSQAACRVLDSVSLAK